MKIARGRHGTSAALVRLLSATLLLSISTAPARAGALRDRLLHMINAARDRHDLRPLRLNRDLSGDALRHTRTMVRRDRLSHSSFLPEALAPYPWNEWGENVGCAGTLRRVHRLFLRSAAHRANILEPGFRRIALGVVVSDGRSNTCAGRPQVWVTEIFYG